MQSARGLDFCRISHGAVTLEFRLVNDRWQHVLTLGPSQVDFRRLASVEGTSETSFPPSPAFQGLQLESPADNIREVQLFGQCGKRLYSGAVLFDAEAGLIEFDLALRLSGRGDVEPAISTYAWTPADPPLVLAGGPDAGGSIGNAWLRVEPLSTTRQPDVRIRETSAAGAGRGFAIGCFDLSQVVFGKHGATVRWRYRIRLGDLA